MLFKTTKELVEYFLPLSASFKFELPLYHNASIRKKLSPCSVGFEVLMAASMKMAVFWVVAPCSLVEVNRRFRDACCLHHQGDDG
jgi:hypothetical protein